MKLSIDEYVDYKHLCVLEGILERNIEYQRLNLPSKDKLLGEVKSELKRLEKLESDRRKNITEPLDEFPPGTATREPGDE
jgi:hypothetical protein